jgi:hypothetical protein
MSSSVLPAAFRDLEPYLDWSLPTERERIAKRIATPMNEIIEFHDVLLSRLESIIEYLNQYSYDNMPDDGQRLCDMALAHVEISNLVEMYKNPAVLNMMDAERFEAYQ